MNTNYEAPQIEVIEIEIEDAVLQASDDYGITPSNYRDGGNAW